MANCFEQSVDVNIIIPSTVWRLYRLRIAYSERRGIAKDMVVKNALKD